MSILFLCHKHGAQPRRPCPVCKREKNRKRKRSALQRATSGVGKRGKLYVERRKKFLVGKLCEINDCGQPATEVHHRIRTEPSHPLWLDSGNWTPACHSCHASLEAKLMTRDRRGWWTGKRDQ
jgi:hypothetical protein